MSIPCIYKEERGLVVDSLYLGINIAVVGAIAATIVLVKYCGFDKQKAYEQAPYYSFAFSTLIVVSVLLVLLKFQSDKEKLDRSRIKDRYKYTKPRKR